MSHRHSHNNEPRKNMQPEDVSPGAGMPANAADEQTEDRKQPEKPRATQPSPQEELAEALKFPVPESTELIRAELEQAKDRALRYQAELDNYRKRASRETEDRLRYANISLMRDLLPVMDNIQRATESAEKSTDFAGLLEGVKLVAQQLAGVLELHQCKKIDALYKPFDPHLHHAILQQPSDEHPANTVIMVTQDGYQLHDRVVRPSQVIVASDTKK